MCCLCDTSLRTFVEHAKARIVCPRKLPSQNKVVHPRFAFICLRTCTKLWKLHLWAVMTFHFRIIFYVANKNVGHLETRSATDNFKFFVQFGMTLIQEKLTRRLSSHQCHQCGCSPVCFQTDSFWKTHHGNASHWSGAFWRSQSIEKNGKNNQRTKTSSEHSKLSWTLRRLLMSWGNSYSQLVASTAAGPGICRSYMIYMN